MSNGFNITYSEEFETYFDFFWRGIVEPVLKQVDEGVDPDFKQATNFSLAYSDQEKYKQDVKQFYHEKRQWLKNYYLPHEDEARLDQHKLGAIWCRALLAYKPFALNEQAAEDFVFKKFPPPQKGASSNQEEDHSMWFVKNVYANHRAAFLVSLGIIYMYLLFDCVGKKETLPDYLKNGGYEYFLEKGKLRCPPPRGGHTDFAASCVIALAKNDISMRDFDYLTYATVLYQIEYYNKLCFYMLQNGLKI